MDQRVTSRTTLLRDRSLRSQSPRISLRQLQLMPMTRIFPLGLEFLASRQYLCELDLRKGHRDQTWWRKGDPRLASDSNPTYLGMKLVLVFVPSFNLLALFASISVSLVALVHAMSYQA
jgi:hypothetical protein